MSIWNKKIFGFSYDVFGLDLSDLSVKAVELEGDEKRQRVRSFSSVDIPFGAIVDGEIINKEIAVSKIKEVIAKATPRKIKSKRAICSLPESKAFLRLINIPKMKKEEIKEAIKWEIEANIPLTLDQVYFDWKILTGSHFSTTNKITVLVIAVSRDIVDKFLEVANEAELEVIGLEIESTAQARSLLDEKKEKKTTMLVDFGGRRTTFLFAVGNVPCFTSSISISAGSLTDAISKEFKISFADAEKIKINHGIGSFIKYDPVFYATKSVLDELIFEMKKSIDFYLSGLRYSSSVDEIIFCGGGSLSKGLIPYLNKELKQSVILGNPWINLNMEKTPLIDKDTSLRYSTAIGLSLRNIDIKKQFDF